MNKIIISVIVCFVMGSYLTFLAERDKKMMNYYNSTIQQNS